MTFPVFIKASRSRLSIAKEIREVNRLRTRYERSMTSRLMGVFKKVGREAAKEYEQSGRISAALVPLRADLDKVFRGHYTAVIKTFSDRVYDNRKRQPFADLVLQYIDREAGKKIRGITATTGRQILSAIRAGEAEGEGVDKIAKRIKEKTGGSIGRARAATIARTETHAAASYATHTATKELNLPAQKKRWVSVSDGRTRDHHRSANGQEVGIDEKFIIRFRGAEIEMDYPHDGSGGAANNINCRCLALYFTDEDALFDSFDGFEEVREVIPELPEVPDTPDAPVEAEDDGVFRLPRNKGVTSATIQTLTKKAVLSKLRDQLDVNADIYTRNGNFGITGYWTGLKDADISQVKIGNMDLETASMAAEAVREITKVGDHIGVPRLRGMKTIRNTKRSAIASMGGGVLNMNPVLMKTQHKVGGPPDGVRRPEVLKKELEDLIEQETVLRDEARRLALGDDAQAYERARFRQKALLYEIRELRINLRISENFYEAASTRTPFNGEELPWFSADYFDDPMDKVRATIYHEFGHHIHQTFKLETRYQFGETKIEKTMNDWFLSVDASEKTQFAVGRYALSNSREYFVESFSMYMMGRKELVHPFIVNLIEERLLRLND